MQSTDATAAEALIQQIGILNAAAMTLQQAVVGAAKKLAMLDRSPDWRDVADLAHLVGRVKMAELAK